VDASETGMRTIPKMKMANAKSFVVEQRGSGAVQM
jgi:hypothetical protein